MDNGQTYVEIELAADDNEARSSLLALCSDAIVSEPKYMAGVLNVVSVVVPLSVIVIRKLVEVTKARIEAKKHVKLKLPGGIEITGERLSDIPGIDELLMSYVKKSGSH